MTLIETRSIDTITVVIERENGVDYVHAKRSNSENTNKDAYLFIKGDEAGGLKFLNSLAVLIGIGPIVKDNELA